MKIKTFKKEEYEYCPIYYRNFGTHFEYLTVINNEIYSAHIEIRPTALNLILYWLGLQKEKYSDQQYKNILKYVRKMAEATIDYILQKGIAK